MKGLEHSYSCETQWEYQRGVVCDYCEKSWDLINRIFSDCNKILDIWWGNEISWIKKTRYRIDPQWWLESRNLFRGKLEEYDFWDNKFDGFFLSNTLYYLDVEKAIEKIKSISNKKWVFLSITDIEPGSLEDASSDYIRPDNVIISSKISMDMFLNTVISYLEYYWFINIKIRYISGKVVVYARI